MKNNYKKKWYQSTTIKAGIVSSIMLVTMISDIDLEEIVIKDLVTQVFALISTGFVIYGRLAATHTIE